MGKAGTELGTESQELGTGTVQGTWGGESGGNGGVRSTQYWPGYHARAGPPCAGGSGT
eukprot:CAMPEP_0173375282 /NCGR_PEP_ID=MMETSP1144-20121109/29546_1 /TAXON_ID=483371 /ORGANISM="non described non described, Strain CCMP2298" /LENGTH=57 /DNA_ID=CAMNT_0014327709 /DNA_START=1249 /DNA_END=1418 /DNA_ORIENTATION=+